MDKNIFKKNILFFMFAAILFGVGIWLLCFQGNFSNNVNDIKESDATRARIWIPIKSEKFEVTGEDKNVYRALEKEGCSIKLTVSVSDDSWWATDYGSSFGSSWSITSNNRKFDMDVYRWSTGVQRIIFTVNSLNDSMIGNDYFSYSHSSFSPKSISTSSASWDSVTANAVTFTFSVKSFSTIFYNNDSEYERISQENFRYYDLPTQPTKTGYTFAGWYTNKNGQGEQITTSKLIKRTSNQEVYAYWKPNNYTIQYDGDEGTGSVNSQSCKYDSSYNLRPNGFSKKGYSFDSWIYNGVSYAEGAKVKNLTTKNNAVVTMKAKWRANTIKIILDPSPGTGGTQNIWYRFKTNTYYNNSSLREDSKISKTSIPSREGYYFLQYNGDGSSGGNNPERYIYEDGTFAADLCSDIYKDAKLNAQWVKERYIYNFYTNTKNNGGTIHSTVEVEYGQTFNSFPKFSKKGYTHVGWKIENKQSGESLISKFDSIQVPDYGNDKVAVEAYPIWEANTIHITLNPSPGNGGTKNIWYIYDQPEIYSDSNCKAPISKITIPTRTGYTFTDYRGNGSSGGGDGERYIWSNGTFADDLHTDIYKDATLYAKWEAKPFKVSFDYNIDNKGIQGVIDVVYDSPYGVLPVPSTGKDLFIGWYTSSKGGTEVFENDIYKQTTDQTLYAHWETTWGRYTSEPQGLGNDDSPYLIASPENLAWVSVNFKPNKVYKQIKDINMSAHTWLPIGTKNNPFSGQYYGQGYIIENLKTTKSTNIRDSKDNNVGLFGYVGQANIETIILRNANIVGGNNVGGIVGYSSGKTYISSCLVAGNVSGKVNVGGIIGSSKDNTSKVLNCVSSTGSTKTDALSMIRGAETLCENCIAIDANGKQYKTAGYIEESWAIIDGMPYPLVSQISWLAT